MKGTDEHLWYMRRAGHVRGPFPQRQIGHYILLGRICDDDELSVDREQWCVLAELPHLVPEVMRRVETEEDRQRLQMARLRADERRGGDRRMDSQRMHGDSGERRRAGDRLQDDDSGGPGQCLESGGHVDRRPRALGIGVLLAIMAALGVLGFLFTPALLVEHADCAAPAAAGVNWDNCKLPGYEAAQADLHGASARNVDFTGAQLVAANFIGADLAYTSLNLADLRRTDLSNARMTGADLRRADLRGARLAGTDMSYADLREARLEGVTLSETRFDNALWVDGRICRPGSVDRCIAADR